MKAFKERLWLIATEAVTVMSIGLGILLAVSTIFLSISFATVQLKEHHANEALREMEISRLELEHEKRLKQIGIDIDLEIHTINMRIAKEKALFEQENILAKELIEAERARDIAKLRAEEALYKEVYNGRGELDCRTIESNETVKLTCINYIENDSHPNPDFKPIRNFN